VYAHRSAVNAEYPVSLLNDNKKEAASVDIPCRKGIDIAIHYVESSREWSKTEAAQDFLCCTGSCQFFIKETVASGSDQAQIRRRAFRGIALKKLEFSK
jgi:hypothetical protein